MISRPLSALIAVVFSLAGGGFALAQAPTATVDRNVQPRLRANFDQGWRFVREDVAGAEKPQFQDAQWRLLDLPHDWSVEGPFDQKAPSGAQGGYLPCGIGWYRKTFSCEEIEGKTFIEFDGVYKNSEVWLNGQSLGKRPFGYMGFQYDLTPHLVTGDNVLAVRVDNSLQPSSRWYTGSGIYRHVWLTKTNPVHVAHWGTQVTTPEVSANAAKVAVATTVRNDSDEEMVLTLRQTVGETTTEQKVTLAAGAEETVAQSLSLPKPQLWSPDSPHLYALGTEIFAGEERLDHYETSFGVRVIAFDPDKGFFLNGESLIIQGMCNHSDLGPLGVALWDEALERRLVMLKEMGCNALRTAHNPSSPELLEMCDRMGFLVVNETFDKWRYGWASEDGRLVANPKRPAVRYGYHLHIDEWWRRDLSDHIRRDRNHPCVIMWSIGNEIPEAQKYGELETVRQMRDLCHEFDPTRPVTAGLNQISGPNETGFAEELDVVGYNGGGGSCFQYEADHLRFPKRAFYASEVPHSLQTRGEYRTHSRYREPERQPPHLTVEEVFPETHNKYESSYDNAGVRISSRDSWRLTKTLPYVAGEFRWTGFDYIGESGGWPRVLGNFGIIDLCNFPKDTYYFYQSQWSEKPMVHLLPHWTWPDKVGTEIPVWCYTNCESVELFLDGKSLGRKTFTPESDMHLQWMVPYQAGELKAVASNDGAVVATTVQRTAGAPARVVIASDRATLEAAQDGRDTQGQLAFLTLSIEDQEGTIVPQASLPLKLELSGPGRIVAVCNGDPLDHTGYQGTSLKTFHGLARVIIAPTGEAGEIVLTAKSTDLPASEVTVVVE